MAEMGATPSSDEYHYFKLNFNDGLLFQTPLDENLSALQEAGGREKTKVEGTEVKDDQSEYKDLAKVAVTIGFAAPISKAIMTAKAFNKVNDDENFRQHEIARRTNEHAERLKNSLRLSSQLGHWHALAIKAEKAGKIIGLVVLEVVEEEVDVEREPKPEDPPPPKNFGNSHPYLYLLQKYHLERMQNHYFERCGGKDGKLLGKRKMSRATVYCLMRIIIPTIVCC